MHEVREAAAKVRSGVDFPSYIQDLRKIGVTEYVSFVKDGHTVFFGEEDFSLETPAKGPMLEVAGDIDQRKFADYLRLHQSGKTDFPAFCRHAAESGVERWIVNITDMTCTYYDKAGKALLVEPISPV